MLLWLFFVGVAVCVIVVVEVGRGGVLVVMHSGSRMTIDPRTSGFHQPGRHCLHQERSAVRCPAIRMKGELQPSKNRV